MKLPNKNEIRKPSKTLSGVTPIAVMLKPKACKHGACLYCPSLSVPQSYTPLSPPVIRAKMLKYDPYEQIKSRLKAYSLMNHPTSKIELIIMGGTFLSYPKKFRENFIKACYDALNNKNAGSFEQAKKINETSKHRCVALCIETRPDTISKTTIAEMLNFGCTRVELGVQAIDDKIYKLVNRGHKLKDVVEATKLLKDANFKVFYHMMLGLPGSNIKKDIQMFKKLFLDEKFKPDGLKIYPCQVIQGAKLVNWYKKGKYKPYTKEQLENMLIKIFKLIPNYCRVMRIMREIPPEFLVAGTTRIDLRRDVEAEIHKRKLKINEIRFREIGFNLRDKLPKEKINQRLKLKITKYNASEGEEYFLEIVNQNNILFALCRLRVRKQNRKIYGAIRELHVYGQSINIGQKSKKRELITQHKGLGKKLIKKAEEIAKNREVEKLYIIAGVGVREYFYKLGYKLENEYMVKNINI